MTASQISSLSPEQVAILNPEQVACLNKEQILAIKDRQRSILKPGDPLELSITRTHLQAQIRGLRKSKSYLNMKLSLFFVEKFCDTNNLKKIGKKIKLCKAISIAISSITVLPLIHDVGVYLYKKAGGA